ncbi:MAG: sulfite exporter TauE/SafE family protein [Actinomycetota bacterium]
MTVEEIAVALVAVVIGSLLKSISGVGLPLITIPAIAAVADIETAVAITAVPNVALNGALTWRERAGLAGSRDLPVLGVTGFVGAIAGTIVLVSVSEDALIALLVVIVILYAVTFVARPDFRIDRRRASRLAPIVGLVSGGLQGSVGISAPVLASWIHSYRLERRSHIVSVTALFAIAGVAQLPALVASGEMTGNWTVALLACIPALATIPFGARLRDRLSSVAFDRFVVATLVASVIGLAIRTFT